MTSKRNMSVEIPEELLRQVLNRAAITSRSRNEEVRYLLDLALDDLGLREANVRDVGGEKRRTVFYLANSQTALIKERARVLHHKVGPEVVRLIAYAIKLVTERDLAIIERMVRGDQQAASAQ
jgi:metal-responsive CopG/Arc/MetJ family transcriptional regulator